ncbi:DUF2937 family protein [Alteromonas sp. C1M14]|uniref:DUF2937 family protein n=1 Tax=Alteromonas sp. C1M14 TaxID=2841567 RepID=UPI001C07FAB8|nr:DUF2937 family protein [Alteromonas sp. C1M14]MBU2977447.1 DUF2937 family protein [Alteromonas sp. C1M14]
MQWLTRFIDKLFFAALFVACLQIPVLIDHYRQYLTGFYDATYQQVEGLNALATQYGFDSAEELVAYLSGNRDAIVRQDAQAKAQLLVTLSDTQAGLNILNHGHYFQRVSYIFSPKRYQTLTNVLDNYTPALPLTIPSVLYSLLLALLLNIVLASPFWGCKRVYQWHKHRQGRLRFS